MKSLRKLITVIKKVFVIVMFLFSSLAHFKSEDFNKLPQGGTLFLTELIKMGLSNPYALLYGTVVSISIWRVIAPNKTEKMINRAIINGILIILWIALIYHFRSGR